MRLTAAVRSCFRNYATFSGRARRAEFWKFVLFLFLVSLLLLVLNSILFGPEEQLAVRVSVDSAGNRSQEIVRQHMYTSGWFGTVFALATLLPLIAAAWRRMHDIGRPGWHLLIPIPLASALLLGTLFLTARDVPVDRTGLDPSLAIPEVVSVPNLPGAIFFGLWLLGVASVILTIVWLARRSQPGPNPYGPPPTEVTP